MRQSQRLGGRDWEEECRKPKTWEESGEEAGKGKCVVKLGGSLGGNTVYHVSLGGVWSIETQQSAGACRNLSPHMNQPSRFLYTQ